MGTDKLSGQPDKMLREGWVNLQWTIPSRRSSNTPSRCVNLLAPSITDLALPNKVQYIICKMPLASEGGK